MKIGILGNGNLAKGLARLAEAAGHQVKLSSHQPAGEFQAAAHFGEVVLIAIPFSACAASLPPLAKSLAEKIVVDCTNPLQENWQPLALDTSAGEAVAALLPQSQVVKAFNTVFADTMTSERLVVDGRPISTFICGNNEKARATIAQLATSMGFHGVEVGPLIHSRYVEGMAHLNIQLALSMGGGTNAGFQFFQKS